MTPRRRVAALLLVLAAIPAAGGCYRHVVNAKGFGATGARFHEPNSPDTGPSRNRTLLKRDSTYLPDR